LIMERMKSIKSKGNGMPIGDVRGLDDVGGRGRSRAKTKCSRGRKKDLVHEILQWM